MCAVFDTLNITVFLYVHASVLLSFLSCFPEKTKKKHSGSPAEWQSNTVAVLHSSELVSFPDPSEANVRQ